MTPISSKTGTHSHMWLVGVLGLIAGLALMIFVPSLKAVSTSLTLFAAFHLVGALVALASVYATVGRRVKRSANKDELDFGWIPAWTLGPLLAAVVFAALAVAVHVAAPTWWPLSMVLTMLACSSFAGHRFAASAAKRDHAALPWVDMGLAEGARVLDGGCGAGRTTIAMANANPGIHVTALDRFDADYIEQGGRALLVRNLGLAGLSGRVSLQAGDLTDLPFPGGLFDGAVSAHAMDHLGRGKEQGLHEIHRVLKPGGRFLLVIWVPGLSMFAVANVLSFALAGKAAWRSMFQHVGFELRQEGHFNGHWFVVLEKPARRTVQC